MLTAVALRALAVWAGILILAIANGALREAVLIPRLGIPAGLVLSGLLLSALILAVAYLSLPWMNTRHITHLWAIGLGWLVLTLVFEFSFGLWQGKSWAVLLEAYTFKSGNIWPVVLGITALAPYVAARLRGWASRRLRTTEKLQRMSQSGRRDRTARPSTGSARTGGSSGGASIRRPSR